MARYFPFGNESEVDYGSHLAEESDGEADLISDSSQELAVIYDDDCGHIGHLYQSRWVHLELAG
eukprot:6052404-Lingulodinium_polyedra.AAC.1